MFAKDKQSSIMKKESKQLRELSEEELRKVTGGDTALVDGGGTDEGGNSGDDGKKKCNQNQPGLSLSLYINQCFDTPNDIIDPGVGPIAF